MADSVRCVSCWGGEVSNDEVVGYFTGYLWDERRPFRGWLCDAHEEIHAYNNSTLGKNGLKCKRAVRGGPFDFRAGGGK